MSQIRISINKFNRGPGTWKFNCSFLYDKVYLKLINDTIQEQREIYAVPGVYTPKNNQGIHTQNIKSFINVDNIEDSQIHFTITDKTFLELLLMRIRTTTMSYAKTQRNKNNDKEQYSNKRYRTLGEKSNHTRGEQPTAGQKN